MRWSRSEMLRRLAITTMPFPFTGGALLEKVLSKAGPGPPRILAPTPKKEDVGLSGAGRNPPGLLGTGPPNARNSKVIHVHRGAPVEQGRRTTTRHAATRKGRAVVGPSRPLGDFRLLHRQVRQASASLASPRNTSRASGSRLVRTSQSKDLLLSFSCSCIFFCGPLLGTRKETTVWRLQDGGLEGSAKHYFEIPSTCRMPSGGWD